METKILKCLGPAFEKLSNAVKSLGEQIRSMYDCNARCAYILPEFTNYCCDVCNGPLVIINHNSDEIIYQCFECGKIHKAKKGHVLVRFKM